MSIYSDPGCTLGLPWENIDTDIQRLMVPGGWLIRVDNNRTHPISDDRGTVVSNEYSTQTELLYIPDPDHSWDEWAVQKAKEIELKKLVTK